MASETDTPRYFDLLERAYMIAALSIIAYHALSVFQIFEGAMQHYTVHLSSMLLLVLLNIALDQGKSTTGIKRIAWLIFAGLMAACAISSAIYLYVAAEALELNQPFLTNFQYCVGLVLLIAVIGLSWVVWGAALTGVGLLSALYFSFGNLIPSPVVNLHFSPAVVMSYLAGMGGPRGVYTFMPLSADTIFLLLVYGGLLSSTLTLDMFEEIGKAIGNLRRGGVGYSCIGVSSLIGMVAGQTVSTIALSGSMTIPTLIRSGFTKDQAGAIETMSANGSQLIPPVMGLGAFLMAVILGVPYAEIARAALLPAAIYILTLAFGVYSLVEASPQIPYERQEVDWKKIFWIAPSFLPSLIIVIVLLSLRYSGNMAAFWGIVSLVGLSTLRPSKYRPSFGKLLVGMRDGAYAGAQLALILATIGLVVQMLVTTGLGTLFGQLMIQVSGHRTEIPLLLGMGICVFIGMGLPTPAAYSLAAIVVIPSLISVGINPLAAHFFGFYFAVYSSFTPPVAVGCLMASRISGGSFMNTCFESIKIGGICTLLPFFFVAFPNSLQFPYLTQETLIAVAMLCVSTVMLSAAIYGGFIGRLNAWERVYMLFGPISALSYYEWRNVWIVWSPFVLAIGFYFYRRRKTRVLSMA